MRCRQSVRAWGLQARAYLRGAPPWLGREPMAQCREALTGGQESWQESAHGTARDTQRWPDIICTHHLDCFWGSLRGQNRLIQMHIQRAI